MSPSNDVFDSDEIYKCENLYTKKVFFDKYFLIVHNSPYFVLTDLKFLVALDDIYREGTGKCPKTGNFLGDSFEYFFKIL